MADSARSGHRGAPAVYFARAVDGVDRADVLSAGREIARLLADAGLQLIDPVLAWDERLAPETAVEATAIVRSDLSLLRKADAMLVDMSIPDRSYIGCVSELTYAYQWQIPSVVWVGATDLEKRTWLRYHATAIVRTRVEAIAALADMLGLRSAPTDPGA